MDVLNELKNLKTDNEDKKIEIINYIDTQFKNSTTEIHKYQLERSDLIKRRDSVLSRYNEVLEKIGISKNSENVVSEVGSKIDSLNKKRDLDDITKKEIANLKEEITLRKKSYTELQNDANSKILDIALEKDIATLLPKYNTRPKAAKYIIKEIKDKAKMENNRLVFKNEDQTTLRIDGREANLEDVVKMKRKEAVDDNNDMFFNIKPQNSGGLDSQAGGVVVNNTKYIPRHVAREDMI